MGKALFDDLVKILLAQSTFTSSTVVSLEVDFELPRGYVAKIREVEMRVDRIVEDFETIASDRLIRYNAALVRDPDDTVTTGLTSNRVEHDVIADIEVGALSNLSAGSENMMVFEDNSKVVNYERMGSDMITARNMRLNIVGAGTDVAQATEAVGKAIIHYTLEKVTDTDILNLLDIL